MNRYTISVWSPLSSDSPDHKRIRLPLPAIGPSVNKPDTSFNLINTGTWSSGAVSSSSKSQIETAEPYSNKLDGEHAKTPDKITYWLPPQMLYPGVLMIMIRPAVSLELIHLANQYKPRLLIWFLSTHEYTSTLPIKLSHVLHVVDWSHQIVHANMYNWPRITVSKRSKDLFLVWYERGRILCLMKQVS